jgi:hypothetical protein
MRVDEEYNISALSAFFGSNIQGLCSICYMVLLNIVLLSIAIRNLRLFNWKLFLSFGKLYIVHWKWVKFKNILKKVYNRLTHILIISLLVFNLIVGL